MLGKYNPDNNLQIRGRVVQTDFSETYKVYENGGTSANILIASYNQQKALNKDKYKYPSDLISVRFYGHVKDEKYPHGGMLERFLSVASTKNTVCIYGHVIPSEYVIDTVDGKKKLMLNTIVCDTFRCDGIRNADSKFTRPEDAYNGLSGLNGKYNDKYSSDDSAQRKDAQKDDCEGSNMFGKYMNNNG